MKILIKQNNTFARIICDKTYKKENKLMDKKWYQTPSHNYSEIFNLN